MGGHKRARGMRAHR